MSNPIDQGVGDGGAAAVQRYFDSRGVTPLTPEPGGFVVAVPIASGSEERLSVRIGCSDNGIDVRITAPRAASADATGPLLAVCNVWNRSHPAPSASVATRPRNGAQEAGCVLQAWLPAAGALADDQFDRFLSTVVSGARSFWSAPGVQQLVPSTG